MRRLHTAALFVLTAIAGSGCCCLRGLSPCTGPQCDYSYGSCGGAGCGIASCGVPILDDCTDCGHDPCTCGAPVDDCHGCARPVFALCGGNLLHAIFGCTGCDSELYWSEWFNDPPACCDPCDDHGYWTGPSGTAVLGGAPPMVAEAPGCPCGMH